MTGYGGFLTCQSGNIVHRILEFSQETFRENREIVVFWFAGNLSFYFWKDNFYSPFIYSNDFTIVAEGAEPSEFWEGLGGKGEYASDEKLYVSDSYL